MGYGRAIATIELGDKELVFRVVTGNVESLKGLGELLGAKIDEAVCELAEFKPDNLALDQANQQADECIKARDAALGQVAKLEAELAEAAIKVAAAKPKQPKAPPKPKLPSTKG